MCHMASAELSIRSCLKSKVSMECVVSAMFCMFCVVAATVYE